MFKCTLCGAILEPHECIITHSEELCEIYVSCPNCRGECVDYDEETESLLLECLECGSVFRGTESKHEMTDECPYCGGGCREYSEDDYYYDEENYNGEFIRNRSAYISVG